MHLKLVLALAALLTSTATAALDLHDLDAMAREAGFVDYEQVHRFCHVPSIPQADCALWEAAMERWREVRLAPERQRLEEAMQRKQAAEEAARERAAAEEAERQRTAAAREAARKAAALARGRITGEILPGDDPHYVRQQWGEPERVRRVVSQLGTTEWWFYGGPRAVQFLDGAAVTVHTGRCEPPFSQVLGL